MKKIILLFISIFFINYTSASNPADILKKIPNNFKGECYEYYSKIDKTNINNISETYKVKLNKNKDIVFTQNGFILPYKYFSDKSNTYKYNINLKINTDYFLDYNYNTYKEINSKTQNEIVLSFDNSIEKNSFNFIFNYKATNYSPKYYISLDNKNWDLIKRKDIETFSFKYLKINFIPKAKEKYLENIKIYELNFPKRSNTFLVNSFFNDNIEIYSTFNCKNKDFNTSALTYDNFSINLNTKTIEKTIETNPKYNVYSKKDYDNDWIEDELDNCKYRYNPDQKDTNGDGKGDICSDDDNDGIIGYYDNCINLSNPNQTDVNRNGVGDICEFDKDKDGIFNSIDNCISKSNPNQEDSDNDGIGNICDNCNSYNPSQIDKNLNGIGDRCELENAFLKENDDDNDGILNKLDNCQSIANPNQEDDDKDGVGNVCDNCMNIQNSNQLDKDGNSIGDMCEDSDNDGIIGYLDNCINTSNSSQEDSDNNGVGNLCEDNDGDNIIFKNDNCPNTYNPEQIDIDNDNIGDKCDEKDDRYIESNKLFFIGLLILITLIFGAGIYTMVKKLK